MGKIFSPDSGLTKALNRIADIMILNVLYILCCLPVITIGASSAAMYSVTLKIVGGRDEGIFKPFFKAFKGSFLKATAMWLILLILGYLDSLGIRLVAANPEALPWYFMGVYYLVGFIVLMDATWVFPLEAMFENSIGKTMKNGVIFGFSKLPVTLLAMVLNAIPVALCLLAPYWFIATSIIWVLFGFSGIAFINSLMFHRVFKKYFETKEEGQEQ